MTGTLKRMMLLAGLSLCLLAPARLTLAADETTTAVHTATATEVRHEGAAGGEEAKPPLLPPVSGEGSEQTWLSAMWVVIIFAILLAVLYPTAWKNVLAGLKKREERIRKDIADAEGARGRAEATLKQYNQQLATAEAQVRDMLGKAAAEAEKIGAGIRMRAQQESEEIKERALKDIDTSKQQALAEIYEQTANISTQIAEKILRRNLNADDQRELVNESLRQMQSLNA
jgi:F-type H+-transporting ATPase subunit b